MTNAFIRLVYQGKCRGWQFLIGALVSLSCFILGSELLFWLLSAYVERDGNPITQIQSLEAVRQGQPLVVGVSDALVFSVIAGSFLFFVGGLWAVTAGLHRRRLRSLITPFERISWRRMAQGFGVYFVYKVVEVLIGVAIAPDRYEWTFQPGAMLGFLPLLLLFIPIQAATEELFFRGYLLQAVGCRLGKMAAIVMPSILFSAMHLSNPDVLAQRCWEGVALLGVYFFAIAVFLAWVTIRDRSLELAIGMHTANNLAMLLLVTSRSSALPSPALLTVRSTQMSIEGLLIPLVGMSICGWLVFSVFPSGPRQIASAAPQQLQDRS